MTKFLKYPNGMPISWKDDPSGKLQKAVVRSIGESLNKEDLKCLKEYFKYYISCPTFEISNRDELLAKIEAVTTEKEFGSLYCYMASEVGYAPY